MKRTLIVPLALALILALAACGTATPSSPTPAPTLKIGVLPIIDALPLYVAQQEGYFAQQKVNVETLLFASAVERDSALQAGQIDGQVNDLVATLLLDKGEGKFKVVRQTYQGSAAKPMMYVLSAPQSNIRTPADLKGVEIGISTNSVIEYSAEMMLRQAGLSGEEIKKIEVSKIPIRFDMLMKGQLQAATLPDPFASLAITQGAHLVADDSQTGVGQSVLTLRQETLDARPQAVKAFLAAYEQAVQAINAAPDKYKQLLVEQAKVPDPIKDTFGMPPYPTARVPKGAEFASVVEWMVEKGLLPAPVAYDKVVTDAYLPGH